MIYPQIQIEFKMFRKPQSLPKDERTVFTSHGVEEWGNIPKKKVCGVHFRTITFHSMVKYFSEAHVTQHHTESFLKPVFTQAKEILIQLWIYKIRFKSLYLLVNARLISRNLIRFSVTMTKYQVIASEPCAPKTETTQRRLKIGNKKSKVSSSESDVSKNIPFVKRSKRDLWSTLGIMVETILSKYHCANFLMCRVMPTRNECTWWFWGPKKGILWKI